MIPAAKSEAPPDYAALLGDLDRPRLEAMMEAGHEVVECLRVLSKSGSNPVAEILRGHDPFYEWDHYPPDDVYDPDSHAQYYYHAHPRGHRGDEHGHFHTFMRSEGMPAGVRPVDGSADSRGSDDGDGKGALCHLIAVSMDAHGLPIGLFTVNRWVTGDSWYRADDVIAMLDGFEIDLTRPSWATNIWLGAMLRLFRPQIEWLIRERDRAIEAWRRRHPDQDVYEDRGLENTSVMAISVERQLAMIDEQIARH